MKKTSVIEVSCFYGRKYHSHTEQEPTRRQILYIEQMRKPSFQASDIFYIHHMINIEYLEGRQHLELRHHIPPIRYHKAAYLAIRSRDSRLNSERRSDLIGNSRVFNMICPAFDCRWFCQIYFSNKELFRSLESPSIEPKFQDVNNIISLTSNTDNII
jgi:hypothetical protein